MMKTEPKTEAMLSCNHNWIIAGCRKNKNRVHNKGDGNGKYQAYKCSICGLFKRRYLK